MTDCGNCGEAEYELSFKELQQRAERPFNSIVRLDGSPIGFPITFCTNPLCETNYGGMFQ